MIGINTINVNIQNPYIEYVDKYSDTKNDYAYAVRVGLVKNLENIWTEDEPTYLQITIFCSDGFGNSKGIYTKQYLK